MHILRQMDPDLHREVLRRRAQLWTDLLDMLENAWERAFTGGWSIAPEISAQEILSELAYGRG